MAQAQKAMRSVDPVWERISLEAKDAVKSEPLMGGLLHACILHHASLEKALSYRFSAKLQSNEMSHQSLNPRALI
jgi:serine O-acetyltransferase